MRDRQLARDEISCCAGRRHGEGGRRNLGNLGTLGNLGNLGNLGRESGISRGHISGEELQLRPISGRELELDLGPEGAEG